MPRKPYFTDVSGDEWALVVPYLALLSEAAGKCEHPLREAFNGLRWLVRAGAPWRPLPRGPPPWRAAYDKTRRWLAAGCFERLAHNLRAPARPCAPTPSASRAPREIVGVTGFRSWQRRGRG